jgi:hypothetical protein
LENGIAAAFSPDSEKMAYFENTGDLYVRDYSASLKTPRISNILSFNFEDPVLRWISGNEIILNSRPSAFYINKSWTIDISKKTIVPFAYAKGLYFNWSADGKQAITFSVDNSMEPLLYLIDGEASVLANLDFMSLPEKCFIGTEKIYCAISQSANNEGRLILPDDYLKRKVYFNDWIYEIDAENRDINLFYSSAEKAIDAYNLTVKGNRILFINRYDNKLYGLELF